MKYNFKYVYDDLWQMTRWQPRSPRKHQDEHKSTLFTLAPPIGTMYYINSTYDWSS